MILVTEILAVIAAIAILAMAGVTLFRNAVAFGRTVKMVRGHAQPIVAVLVTQSDTARQRVFSITANADLLQRKAEMLRVTIRKMLVVINALREARGRISLIVRKLGF